MSRADKVTLCAVQEAKEEIVCAKHCLQDIDAHDILSLRYQALSMKEYAERGRWIVNCLRGFIVSTSRAPSQIKFETKVVGHSVCHACFANAVGYSLSRLDAIMADIRDHDVINVSHGNTGRQHEGTHISMARSQFESYIRLFGEPQPHRHARRKSDGLNVGVICLPMNVRRHEVWTWINNSLQRMGEDKIGLSTFKKMWKAEFTNVHVPAESRFSKCQICWEYKESIKSMPNEVMKAAMSERYQKHIDLTMEEQKDYTFVRQAAIQSLDDMLSIIIDGMDQNTTYVPRFKQTVKGIESRYVKTHLCGVLVHGLGLYCHVWVDSHHKHNSNQVVTSIM